MTKKSDDILDLSSVEGLGPATIKLLNEANILSTLDLACKTPTFLKDITGKDKHDCAMIFAKMRNRLEKAGFLYKQELTATQAAMRDLETKYLSTGVQAMDKMLGGGIASSALTMIFGENGAGKTQSAMQLCIMTLKADEKASALYIDTEHKISPRRLIQCMVGQKLVELDLTSPTWYQDALKNETVIKYLDRIHIVYASDGHGLESALGSILPTIKPKNIKLVVLDSIAAAFRGEYVEMGNTSNKFRVINTILNDLAMIAITYNIQVVMLNQIYTNIDSTTSMGRDTDRPYGGNVVGHKPDVIIKFWKTGKANHHARITKSSHHENVDCLFTVTGEGIADMETKKRDEGG